MLPGCGVQILPKMVYSGILVSQKHKNKFLCSLFRPKGSRSSILNKVVRCNLTVVDSTLVRAMYGKTTLSICSLPLFISSFNDIMDKRPSPQKQNSPYNAPLQILKYNSFRIFITHERFQFSEILILYHINQYIICTKKSSDLLIKLQELKKTLTTTNTTAKKW